jgi:hypothetical protein
MLNVNILGVLPWSDLDRVAASGGGNGSANRRIATQLGILIDAQGRG